MFFPMTYFPSSSLYSLVSFLPSFLVTSLSPVLSSVPFDLDLSLKAPAAAGREREGGGVSRGGKWQACSQVPPQPPCHCHFHPSLLLNNHFVLFDRQLPDQNGNLSSVPSVLPVFTSFFQFAHPDRRIWWEQSSWFCFHPPSMASWALLTHFIFEDIEKNTIEP